MNQQKKNCENLIQESIRDNIFITGNTVIDSFQYTVQKDYSFHESLLDEINFNNNRVVLVTAHRRENQGEGIRNICSAILKLAKEYKDVSFIYPVHLSPAVRDGGSWDCKSCWDRF